MNRGRRQAGPFHAHGAALRLILVLLAASLAGAAPAAAGEAVFVRPGPRDKCPVCGMFVARYPDWTAEIVRKDGSLLVFDGPKDFFRHWLAAGGPGEGREEPKAAFVTDYYSLAPTDAFAAFYVLGSNVQGPMGRELVPFAREEEAREFLLDHRGKRVLRFPEVTSGILRELE